jgi:hypothetical protein
LLSAQTVLGSEEIQDAPKSYHSPAFYAVTSVVPGLGQFLLGEPIKGTVIALTHVGSIAAVYWGFYLAATDSSVRPVEGGWESDFGRAALEAFLVYGGTY